MRVVCIFRDNQDYSRSVNEWLENFRRQTGREIEIMNPDTNTSFCETYDVVEYPNALGFELKLDVFNQNINSLFDELDTLVDCKKFCLYNHKEETISLELNRYDDDYDYEYDWQKEHNYGKRIQKEGLQG